jgi:hypothetical protein
MKNPSLAVLGLVPPDRDGALCLEMQLVPRGLAILRRGRWVLAAWLLLGTGGGAAAGTSDIVTRVDCPALPPDPRAEFEARAQVDLALRSAGGGELEAVCDRLVARVTWRPRGGGRSFERTVSGATPAALVDALLFAVAELAAEATRVPEPETTPAEPDENPATPPPPGRRPRDTASTGEESAERAPRGADAAASPIAIFFGLDANLLSTVGSGAAGPHAGMEFGLPGALLLRAGGGYEVGFGASNPISVQIAEVRVDLSTMFGQKRAYELGLGARGGLLTATANLPFAPSTSQSQALFALVGRARYALTWGSWRVAFGPDVQLNLPPAIIAVDQVSAWEISTLSAGLAVDVANAVNGSSW